MEPVNLKDCMREWTAYRASVEGNGKPITHLKAPDEGYADLGMAVATEMQEDPVFFRLVVGKLGGRIWPT
jgi:hypothetical protein